ncbi:hypothetical protein CEUSTIGMA_g7551.t1 [Chlamydomonas eustigma]|uniref:Uncharacterized protein n=1 Tax=Chlamydomonas eustigma TaxID=1157962 RepID=A0A250XAG9_9CHLO|nr:hypothetical protein CEUSTIGMA_g7551.t1 [Chlamydomonas eustigma]|eukprot:GAX80113.1 hypothetical protein CEUSTIGMA_g7551.t1 [Chlamydomonas eustigma]
MYCLACSGGVMAQNAAPALLYKTNRNTSSAKYIIRKKAKELNLIRNPSFNLIRNPSFNLIRNPSFNLIRNPSLSFEMPTQAAEEHVPLVNKFLHEVLKIDSFISIENLLKTTLISCFNEFHMFYCVGIAKEAEELTRDTLHYEAEQTEISRAGTLRLAGLSAAERKAAKDAVSTKVWALIMQAMNNVRDKGTAYDKEHGIPDDNIEVSIELRKLVDKV